MRSNNAHQVPSAIAGYFQKVIHEVSALAARLHTEWVSRFCTLQADTSLCVRSQEWVWRTDTVVQQVKPLSVTWASHSHQFAFYTLCFHSSSCESTCESIAGCRKCLSPFHPRGRHRCSSRLQPWQLLSERITRWKISFSVSCKEIRKARMGLWSLERINSNTGLTLGLPLAPLSLNFLFLPFASFFLFKGT